MTKITLEWVEKLADIEADSEQFDMIKDLDREELQDVIAHLLGIMKCKNNIIRIIDEELKKL